MGQERQALLLPHKIAVLLGTLAAALPIIMACASSKVSSSPTPDAALLGKGQELYTLNCQTCHGDVQGIGRIDPAPPHNSEGHTWHHADGQLIQIVMDGSSMMRQMMGLPQGTLEMPPFREILTKEEVFAILSYIKTWWREEERAFQAEVSRMWEKMYKP